MTKQTELEKLRDDMCFKMVELDTLSRVIYENQIKTGNLRKEIEQILDKIRTLKEKENGTNGEKK